MEENVKMRQIIIPLPHLDSLFSLAEAASREKNNKKPSHKKLLFEAV
jgi:hypothetical protein